MKHPGSEISTPPQELIDVVGGGIEIGSGHLVQLQQAAALRPDEHVLDIGCGIGRTAIPLTSYLSEDGAYEGFDIRPEAIEWCQREVTSRYPNFRFTHVDVFNAAYNPSGALRASEFSFPYRAEQFDLVFLYSVFTHLLPEDLEHYLSEIGRVLKEGGRVLATFFLLNDASLSRLASAAEALAPDGDSVARSLLERDFGYYSAGHELAEWMVGYKEEFVRDLYRKHCFRIKEPIAYGTWLDSETLPEGIQDLILAYR
jgi:SAM-dependent methyltransferase